MSKVWIPLHLLRKGAIFETRNGTRAVKTAYQTFNDGKQCDCYLLDGGESAHFPLRNEEPVREIEL